MNEHTRHNQHFPHVNLPLVFLVAPFSLVFLITYFAFMFTHWTAYVAMLGTLTGGVMLFLGAIGCVIVAWLASKALQAFFTALKSGVDVIMAFFQGLAGVYRSFSEARGQSIRNKVITQGDDWAVVVDRNGDVQMLSTVRVRQDVPSLPSPDDKPALPPPVVPTGRQLLLQGVVAQALSEGFVILGLAETGKLLRLRIKKLFSMLISGLPATGKTTTVFWIVSQLTLIGAKFWVADPHMNFENEDGEKSLAAELSSLADSFVFPPCDDDPESIIERVQWMYDQLRIRQQPGYIVRAEDTVIGIMDEFNSVAASIDPKRIVVTHRDQPHNFAKTLALLEREGRKYGLHFMLIGHKWAQQDIGGDNAVRTNASTYLCHRLNDETQANLLLGRGQGKEVLKLTVGTYWITGSSWNGEPAKVTTPMISALDLPVLLQVKGMGGVQVLNQENVVEAVPVTSGAASTMTSGWRPQEENGRHSGRDVNQPGQPLDATTEEISIPVELRSKIHKVLEMDAQSANQNDIIKDVWGVDPDSRAGRAAKEELKIIRAYIAEHTRKTMRLGA